MSEPYIGEIRMFAGNYAPVGWAFCNGAELQINENDALFALIGTTYGGDGTTTFCLPDLRGRIPLHMGQNSASGTTYALGQKAGSETVMLTADQLPSHTHAVSAQMTVATGSSPDNAIWASSTIKQYSNSNSDAVMKGVAISLEGGNQPHDNMMPFLPVSFIIALAGLYPSQN
jgi:microcystin-dependent protein